MEAPIDLEIFHGLDVIFSPFLWHGMVLFVAMVGIKTYVFQRYDCDDWRRAFRQGLWSGVAHWLVGRVGTGGNFGGVQLHAVIGVGVLCGLLCLALSLIEGALIWGLWSKEQRRKWRLAFGANVVAYAIGFIAMYAEVRGLGRLVVDFWAARLKR